MTDEQEKVTQPGPVREQPHRNGSNIEQASSRGARSRPEADGADQLK